MQAGIILLAIAPGLFIAWYIYRLDKHEREPRIPLALTFISGLGAAWVAVRIESWGMAQIPVLPSLALAFVASFLLVSLVEEGLKWLVLMAYPYRRPFFNEPMDGITYAVMIAMGLATFENVLFAIHYDLNTILLRTFTAIPAHGFFAIIMGYYVGRAHFATEGKSRILLKSWLVPFSLHGIYDFFLFQKAYKELVVLAAVTLGYCFFLANRLLTEHQENSPFK